MARNRELRVELVGDPRSLSRSLRSVAKDVDHTGSRMHQFGKAGALALGSVGAAAGGALVIGLKKAVDAYAEAEKIGAQTNAVLKSTHHQAGVTAKGVADLATAISRKSGLDDEAVQSAENLLLTFTKVRNEAGKGNDVFTRGTKIVADMSVALGTDMHSSAIQVGKALNDPIKGITALQRVGVSFTQQQRDQIKALEDSGQHLKAQKLILHELNTEFGGSAKAAGDTFQGSLNKAKVEVGNLGEEIGSVLAPMLKRGTDRFTDFVKEMQTGKGAGGRFADELKHGAKDAEGHIKGLVGRFHQLRGEGQSSGKALATVLSEEFSKGLEKAAEGAAERAPKIAGAFVRGFANANIWGKLILGGVLLSKMGGLGAFSGLGGSGGGAAAKGFGARFKSGLRSALKGAGIASIISGALTSAALGGRAGDRLQNFLSGATFGLVPQAGLTRLKQTTDILKVFNARVGNFNPAKIHNAAGQLRKLADAKLGHDWFDHGKLLKAAEDLDHLGQRSAVLRSNIGRMRKGSITDIRELRKVFASNMADIASIMGQRSKQGARAMSRNTDGAIKTIKGFMRDGVLTTRRGMAEIERIFEAEARAFGISPKSARESAHVRAFDLAHGDPRGGRPAPGAATGGFIGSPGEAGGDNIPIVVGRGEAVLNRYQQAPVEMALRSTYGMGLDDLFSQVQRPHYMARGGKVRGFAAGGLAGVKPGVRKAASAVLSRFPGLVVTSTTGGGHAPGSFHYKGEAVDVSGDSSSMYRASQWIKSSGLYRGLAEGIHNPNLAVKYGQLFRGAGPFGGVWANHSNHIHIAVAGALKAAGFSAAQIKRILVSGPPSYVKTIAQGALDTARKAGNARLSSLSASAGGGDLAGAGIQGGGGNRANMALGRRLLHSFGYGDNQWPALRSLWTRESGWRTTATNPSSGAYGIPQSLPGSKMATAGADWRTNPTTQIRWGLGYIRSRYGSPRGALAHENSYGWYARGGRVGRRAARGLRPTRGRHNLLPHSYSGYRPSRRPPQSTGFRSPLVGDFPSLMQPGEAPEPVTVIDLINQSISDIQLQADAGLIDQGTAAARIHGARQFAINSGQLGDRDKWQLMADDLQATAQATEDNTAALQAQTDAMNGLKDELRRQNDFAENVTAVNGLSAIRALADVLAGNLGPRVQQRIQSPSFGAVARA